MSWSNEKLIEELIWVAHSKNLGGTLVEMASKIQLERKTGVVDSYLIAMKELNLEIPD
jgi:hypothetical protein